MKKYEEEATMGDLLWSRKRLFTFPLAALRHHAVCLGASGSGKTETLYRCAYGAYKIYRQQVIYLDAKGESKRAEEKEGDNAARFAATMRAAGARSIRVFPATYYNGWQGTPAELQNRLLAVIDFSESQYYGDVAANAVYLALHAPTTPRSSDHFLANLHPDRLKEIYKDAPRLYERVLRLDRHLLAQVRMRYEVFFNAMRGQLDGDLAYEDADAVYLRVRGFTLRQEAPRLGRFLVYDFMHYIAERRRSGVNTLFIIAAQGYAGLGPNEYADRILDATNTYILHSCSDPFQVSKRAGKRFRLETSWTEQDDEDRSTRRHIRLRWDWKVPENAVMQQQEGQAFWINRGRAQQAQIVRVPIVSMQIADAWEEIRQQEEIQRAKLTPVGREEREHQEQAKNRKAGHPAISPQQNSTSPGASSPAASAPSKSHKTQPPRTIDKQSPQTHRQKTTKTPAQDVSSMRKGPEASTSTSFPVSPPTQMPQSDVPPDGSRDDDGPDYL
jgi:hypothetical protein